MIEHQPEIIGIELAEVGNNGAQHLFHALRVERKREVMVVDHIVTFLRAQDHRDHVVTQEISDLLCASLPQAFALFFDLMHPDRNLRGTQVDNRNRR